MAKTLEVLSVEMIDLFENIKQKSRDKNLHLVNNDILDIQKMVMERRKHEELMDWCNGLPGILKTEGILINGDFGSQDLSPLVQALVNMQTDVKCEVQVESNEEQDDVQVGVNTEPEDSENELSVDENTSNDEITQVEESADDVTSVSNVEAEAEHESEPEGELTVEEDKPKKGFVYKSMFDGECNLESYRDAITKDMDEKAFKEYMVAYEDDIAKFIDLYLRMFPTSAEFFIVANKGSLVATAYSKDDALLIMNAAIATYDAVDVMSAVGLVAHKLKDSVLTEPKTESQEQIKDDITVDNDVNTDAVSVESDNNVTEVDENATESETTDDYGIPEDDYDEYAEEESESEEPYYEEDPDAFLDEIPDGSENI